MTVPLDPRFVLAIIGGIMVGAAGWALQRLMTTRRWGALVAFDDGRRPPENLVSERLGLVGRPDEVWRLRDGRPIPVEIKSRRAPFTGTFASHRVQVEAYCLLLESTTGLSPPYGVLTYAGGESRRVLWDDAARSELLSILAAVRRPYDGEADPSPRKCAGCRWRPGCDASLAS
ncbi:MAG: Dna2/Cas4 domain-containing protein [Thermoplasmata archaeon]|nr:Dna2/Cas4 domain-containing protein [Thermoplasmata archaeon]